jgi:hypothetical protein
MVQKQSYNFESKEEYRQIWANFIFKQFPKEKIRRGLDVVCLPGPEALEIIHVYDKLGIPRRRIWGVENHSDAVRQLRNLNLGIQIYEGDLIDFFNGKPDVRDKSLPNEEKFDIVNLDFQGQFKGEETNILSAIFHNNHYRKHMLLGTNFFGSRERGIVSEAYKSALSYYTGVALSNSINNQNSNFLKVYPRESLMSLDFVNDSLRDKSISIRLKSLISSDSLEESIKVFGRERINELVTNLNLPVSADEIMNNPSNYYDIIKNLINLRSINIENMFCSGFGNEGQNFMIFIDAANVKRPFYIRDFFKGRYVSDNGAPMFFDFLDIQIPESIISKYSVDETFANPVKGESGFMFIKRKEKEGTATKTYISQSESGRFLGFNELIGFSSDFKDLAKLNLELLLNNISPSENFIVFKGDIDEFFKDLNTFKKWHNEEVMYVLSERKDIAPLKLAELVKRDISVGISDEEIMDKYSISKSQIGGYKAAISRGGNLVTETMPVNSFNNSSPVLSNKTNSVRNGNTSISQEDFEQIEDIIYELNENGNYAYRPSEIAELFSGKYPWQVFAALRAKKSKKEGIRRSITSINPTLYHPTPQEEEIITEFISDIQVNGDDILGLIPITKMQLAARKARLTKQNQENNNSPRGGIRNLVLSRDRYCCQYPGCNMTLQQNKEQSGHGLHVHHIDYNHNNNDIRNQITLCTSHHAMTNTVQHAAIMRETLELIIKEKQTEGIEVA